VHVVDAGEVRAHFYIVFPNLVRSPSEHLRKKALQPIPQGKRLGMGFIAMEMWRRSDSERQKGLIECGGG
jgi:hypothetical protein